MDIAYDRENLREKTSTFFPAEGIQSNEKKSSPINPILMKRIDFFAV